MAVDAERPAHAEDVDGLHGLHRQAFFVEELLKLPPTSSGLDVDRPVRFVELDLVEIS